MNVGGWSLIHCDDSAIVTALRANGQAVVRFVLITPGAATTWTFAIDEAALPDFMERLTEAWRPSEKTIIGPAPAEVP